MTPLVVPKSHFPPQLGAVTREHVQGGSIHGGTQTCPGKGGGGSLGVSPWLCAGDRNTAGQCFWELGLAGSETLGGFCSPTLPASLLPPERVREETVRHRGVGFSVQRRAALVSENPQLSHAPVQGVTGGTGLVGGDTLSMLHASRLTPSSLPHSHPLVCPIACGRAEGWGCGGDLPGVSYGNGPCPFVLAEGGFSLPRRGG